MGSRRKSTEVASITVVGTTILEIQATIALRDIIVSLHNRTAGRRRRQNARV